jgi:hypothetical protein
MAHRRTAYNDWARRAIRTKSRQQYASESGEVLEIRRLSFKDHAASTRPIGEISFPTNELYRSTEKVIARWEDSQYSINRVRSRFLNSFALAMFSKRLDAQAEAAIAKSLKPEGREDQQKEIDSQKKETDNLELARQKNGKISRP